MRISDLPIAWRIGLAVTLPIIGLAVFIGLYVQTEFALAKRIEKIHYFTEFSRDISGLIHELQRERGNSAGYVSSSGTGEFSERLSQQRERTDQAVNLYSNAVSALPKQLINDSVAHDLQSTRQHIENLDRHRQAVWDLQTDVGQAVGPYTRTINSLIELLADEVHALAGQGSIEPMIALLALIHAKENAGIERAVGAGSFSAGQVKSSAHVKALTLVAKQEAFFEEFRELMPPLWDEKLDAFTETVEARAVDSAREVLISGGYGAPIDAYSGPEWFDLTTKRIDLMMELETELANELINDSVNEFNEHQNTAFIVLFSGLGVLVATLVISTYMVISVVRPLKSATVTLVRLAEGDTNVNVIGADRKDELGAMAKATLAFLDAMREREQSHSQKAALERNAMKERTRLLAEMSEEVKSATQSSVGGVANMAANLRTKNSEVRESLTRAGHDADQAEVSASETLQQADRAADLAGELSQAISEVTEQVTHGDALARDAVSRAASSREEVEELQAAANQIGDFVSIISGLAEQTNLLALNATIESARAGEAGKGFAVVASEVKSLAEQTNKSANEIAERVQQIQARTGGAAQAISAIADSIDSLGEVTAAVAAAMEEQRASAGSFAQFVEENRTALTQVSGQIKSMAEIARQSASDSESMSDLVSQMAEVAKEASDSIPAIVDQSIEAAQNRENNPRYEVEIPISIRIGQKAYDTKMIDISLTGAGFEDAIGTIGDIINLNISDHTIKAEIKTHRNGKTGMIFRSEVSEEMLKGIINVVDLDAA